MINPMDLTGKLVLVTGASSGIGRETAIHISRLGGRVVLVARREDELAKTLEMLEGAGHASYAFDLSHIEEIESFVKKIVAENSPFDGFVHCAGKAVSRPLQFVKYNIVHDMMLVNFYSFIELVRCISKKDNYKSGASIIGISSIAATTCQPAHTIYAASKAAMNAAMKCLSLELSVKGIRLNTVLPAMIATEMWNRHSAVYDRSEDYYKQGGSMGVGEPIDVANMVVYLLSNASKFITRDEIEVTGGYYGQNN